jgi:GT2 family glycosyltransferase
LIRPSPEIGNITSPKRTTKKSRVLYVLPTLGDRLDLLEQTLDSVYTQKPEAPDIYLVCPAGNLEIRKLAKKYNARILNDPAEGLSAALNIGFAQAKPWHQYASWLGDDDLLRPGSLAATTAAFDKNPNAVVAYGYCDYIDSHGKIIFTNKPNDLAPWIMKWGPNLVPLIGVLYRLSAANESGGYDTTLKYAMDLDMWLRLIKKGDFINTKATLGAFRWHKTSTTVANRQASLHEAQTVKRRYLARGVKPLAPLWESPVKVVTKMAARRVNRLS